MADGMDKAFWLATQPENLAFAYETLWEAAVVHEGKQDRDLGIVPLRTGGFVLVSKQDSTQQAWLLAHSGDLRPLVGRQLLHLVAHL